MKHIFLGIIFIIVHAIAYGFEDGELKYVVEKIWKKKYFNLNRGRYLLPSTR